MKKPPAAFRSSLSTSLKLWGQQEDSQGEELAISALTILHLCLGVP